MLANIFLFELAVRFFFKPIAGEVEGQEVGRPPFGPILNKPSEVE